MTDRIRLYIFLASVVAYGVTLIWLFNSISEIPGVFVQASVTLSRLKTVMTSQTIDIPFDRQNMRVITGYIGVPLYLNLISLCVLLRFLPFKDK